MPTPTSPTSSGAGAGGSAAQPAASSSSAASAAGRTAFLRRTQDTGTTSATSGLTSMSSQASGSSSMSMSSSGSVSMAGSVQSYNGAAPTPFNTFFDEYAYAETMSHPEPELEATTPSFMLSDSQVEEAMPYNPTAFTPAATLSPTTSRWDSTPATRVYSNASSDYIPPSSRPVPAPPQLTSVISHDGGADLSPIQSVCIGSSMSTIPDEHPKRFTSRFRRKPPPTQVDRDTQRLQQLGYDAVLGRSYTFWSSFAIAFANIGCLQGTVFAVPGAYKYGGPAMMLVAWPLSAVLSMALVLTMGELASAYPVAGAMASWAWKCARGGVGGERYWGWVTGAIVLGGHVGNLILCTTQAVKVITGMMGLALDYDPEPWQMVLFFFAVVAVVGTVGSTAFGSSPRYWIGAGSFGFLTWFALCVALLATGVRNRDFTHTQAISTHFINGTGWNSKGLVYILGWQYCTIATGADVSAHMSEETQNPSRNVPNAMVLSVAMTYILAYISIILLLLSVDPQDAEYLAAQSFPVGHILAKAISLRGSIAMCCLILLVMLFQMQAQLQAASRFTFALARDRALPFSDTIKKTNKAKQPWVANWFVVGLWTPFGCLLAGGTGVVYSVITSGAAALSMLSYLIPVALYLLSKKDLQSEGRSLWSLRRWSRPVASVGALFALTLVVVQCLPSQYPFNPTNMSWSYIVIFVTLLISFVMWKLYGDANYSGPIRALTKWETGVEIDLDTTLVHSTRGAGNVQGSETSLKLAVTPCFDDTTVQTVQVASARTVDTVTSMGEWAQASFSSDGSGSGSGSSGTTSTASPRDFSREIARSRSATQTMGRVPEVAEEEEGDGSSVALVPPHTGLGGTGAGGAGGGTAGAAAGGA